MKKKLLIFLVLVLIFVGFIAVRYFIMDSQNAAGRLKIISSPSAGVFIDNVAVGKTPWENQFKVGEYMVKLIPEGDATATASWQGKVKVNKNALSYINRELGGTDLSSAGEIFTVSKMDRKPTTPDAGEIYVETDPNGAIVYLDNDEKGVAPLILSDVIKGDHELSVFMPGFFRRTQKVNVDTGYRVSASFKLAIDQAQQKPSSAEATAGKPEASPSAALSKKKVTIGETPLGFLRVREDAAITASESARVKPGQTFDLLEEKGTWYKIEYEAGKQGWVSSEFSKKSE
ncbi:MAG: hypothetical protein RI947_1304 [Candidatus Parcubacteria bacterium]|jgi:hypothetical protein